MSFAEEESFEQPRLRDGRLASLHNCNGTALLALHRAASHARWQRRGKATLGERCVTVDVAVRKLPRGDDPRHFYMSVYARTAHNTLVQVSEERLVTTPGDDYSFESSAADFFGSRRVVASFQGILASELKGGHLWLVCRAYRVGRLREDYCDDGYGRPVKQVAPTNARLVAQDAALDKFDALVDEVGVFRQPLGCAALELSAALERNDLELSSDAATPSKLTWDATAPLWRAATTDLQHRAHIFARLPWLIATRLDTSNNNIDTQPPAPPPPPGDVSTSPGQWHIEASAMRIELSIGTRLEAPALASDAMRLTPPGGLRDAVQRRAKPHDHLYITLVSGVFSQEPNKLAARSIEVRARLINSETGNMIACLGRGQYSRCTQYRSTTLFHASRPFWDETIRVALPDDDLRKYHLQFSLAQCRAADRKAPARQPFAVAVLPLASVANAVKPSSPQDTRHTFLASLPIRDGDHRLPCFKPPIDDDEQRASTKSAPVAPSKEAPVLMPQQHNREPNPPTAAAIADNNASMVPLQKELFVVRTALVSERRPPADATAVYALMRWRSLEPGAPTATIIRAAAKEALEGVVNAQRQRRFRCSWPSRLFFRAFVKPVLSIFAARRVPAEPGAAFAALASTLAALAKSRRDALKRALRQALAADFDGVLPEGGRMRSSLAKPTKSPPTQASSSRKPEEETWLPSSVADGKVLLASQPATELDENPSPRGAEESWARFLALAAGGVFAPPNDDGDDNEKSEERESTEAVRSPRSSWSSSPVLMTDELRRRDTAPTAGAKENSSNVALNFSSPTVLSKSALEHPTLHAALLKSISATLARLGTKDSPLIEGEDPGSAARRSAIVDTVASLDSLMAIVCTSFARAGGGALEGTDNGNGSTSALVDDVLSLLMTRVLARPANRNDNWHETARKLGVASLAGMFESLQACFPFKVVSQRVAAIVAALGQPQRLFDASCAALELDFLRSLARDPVLRASTDDEARLDVCRAIAGRAVSIQRGASCAAKAEYVEGLAAQVIGELVSAVIAAKDTQAARDTAEAVLPRLLVTTARAASTRQYLPDDDDDMPQPLLKKQAFVSRSLSPSVPALKRSPTLRRAPGIGNSKATSAAGSPSSPASLAKRQVLYYWQSSFRGEAADCEREAARPSAASDSAQDLTATCLSLLRVAPQLRGELLRSALCTCGRLASAFDAERWPLLSACAWSTCSRVLDEAATETEDPGLLFDLGLAILEAPETDVAAMSDARLTYLLEAGGEKLADLRPATVERLDVAWRSLAPHARLKLRDNIISRAARLIGRQGAVSALVAGLVADLLVAELALRGNLAGFEQCMVDVLDEHHRQGSREHGDDCLAARALETTIPALVAERLEQNRTLCRDDESWRLALQRAAELHTELATLSRHGATDIERALAHGRLVALDGPLLRPGVHGDVNATWKKRAARRARDLALVMARHKHRVEAGLALLRVEADDDNLDEEIAKDLQIAPQFNRGADVVDETIAARCGDKAGRVARSRRVASRLFEAASPPAWELSLACSEATLNALRGQTESSCSPSNALNKRTREALAVELRRAAGYYALLDAQNETRRPCVVFRCRFDMSHALPVAIRGKEFACRGEPGEQLADFVDKLKADISPELVIVPSQLDLSTSFNNTAALPRCQVSTIVPVAERRACDPSSANDNAASSPLADAFAFADLTAPWRPSLVWAHEWPRSNRAASSALDVWVERRLVTLNEPLPAPTRWVAVKSATTTTLNPLEVALRQLRDKNSELRHIIDELEDSPDAGAQQRHTMAINGVVDAAVNGGLANWTPLATGAYKTTHPDILADLLAHPDKANLPDVFQSHLDQHLALVAKCVALHRDKCPSSMRPLATHIEQTSWPKLKAQCAAIKREAAISS